MSQKFIIFGDGKYAEYYIDLVKKGYHYFCMDLSKKDAEITYKMDSFGKRKNVIWNYNPKTEKIMVGYPIVKTDLNGKSYKKIWCLKNHPGITLYFVEFSFGGEETPFSERRSDLLEEIKQKRELLNQLVKIKRQRDDAYSRAFRIIRKEVRDRTSLIKTPYAEKFAPEEPPK